MKITDLLSTRPINYDTGLHYHIYKAGRMPSSIKIQDFDENRWQEFLSYVFERCRWDEDDKIHFENHSADGQKHKQILWYLKANITLWTPNSSTAFFIYDSKSKKQTLNNLIERFKKISPQSSCNSIGLIRGNGGMMEVKSFEYVLPENSLIPYLDSLTQECYHLMKQQLENSEDGGLFLLYGEPGTGKTSFIKRILSEISKKALFITPFFTENLTSPHLISLLMDYPDSILIIEDAESVIMERQADNSSAVSNLLNLTDGFLADFLNLKIICTFNTELDNIDEALLRDGRLKGMHKFTKLDPHRAAKIAEVLGSNVDPKKPMTLAEISNTNRNTNGFRPKKIGFNDRNNGNPF